MDYAWKTAAVATGDMVSGARGLVRWVADPVRGRGVAADRYRDHRRVPRRESGVFGRLRLWSGAMACAHTTFRTLYYGAVRLTATLRASNALNFLPT